MKITPLMVGAGLLALGACSSNSVQQASTTRPGDCTSLTGVSVRGGQVASAAMAQTGGGTASQTPYCRVQLTLKPEPGSNIRVELWLPEPGRWNGKFLGTGNGGAAGSIQTAALAAGLARGYAVANTDMGSSSGQGGLNFGFGIGRPDLQKDFSYRSTDGMTLEGKRITAAYYGRAPQFSYFQGCSTGGYQAWEQIHRLPGEYDGVIAGAAANDRPNLHMNRIWADWQNQREPGASIPRAKLAVVQRAATAACDEMDGLKDGIIDDPRRCTFDPVSMVCRAGDGPDCLTPRQAQTMRLIYQGARNPRTGAQVYPGFERGSEAGVDLHWDAPVGPGGAVTVKDSLMNWSERYQKAHPDGVGFDFDQDVARVNADLHRMMNYTDPKLSRFQRQGGKVIIYHGWADSLVPALGSPNYYERIAAANGGFEKTKSFARLFMAPGMGHCRGGVGPDQFDALGALEAWVERGQAPERIVASRPARGELPAMSRPLCPYPAVARWTGQGSPNEAANFTCRAPA